MADPFLGEIRAVGFNYAPQGWAMCNGQLLAINQNSALFALLGTMYGGNGQTTFGLPNLQSRVLIGMGNGPGLSNYFQGQIGGAEKVTMSSAQLPSHSHGVTASSQPASQESAQGGLLPSNVGKGSSLYTTAGSTVTMATNMIQPTGNGAPVPTLPPYLAINFIIALQGIFPPRS